MLNVWSEIRDKLIYNLIDSIITRINIALEIKGWYTRF